MESRAPKKDSQFPARSVHHCTNYRLQPWFPASVPGERLRRRRGSREFNNQEPRTGAAIPLELRTRSMDKQLNFLGKSRVTRADRRFDALLLPSASIVWWMDAAGEFVEEQPCWQEYTGQTWDEYKGSRWVSCLHPDDRKSIMADWGSALASGSPYFTQGRIWSAKHNGYRAFQTRGIPVKDQRGQVEEWLGALTDIQDPIDIKVLLDGTQTDLADSLKALRARQPRSPAPLSDLQAVEAQLANDSAVLKQLNEASSRLWQAHELHAGLNEILGVATELLGADKGNVQLFDTTRKVLVFAAHQGFEQPFLDFFKEVSAEFETCCGRALRSGRRTFVEDAEADEDFAQYRAVFVATGFSDVQHDPLVE